MGFKLPGKSITSGTSAHRSALKAVEDKKSTSWFRGEEGWIPDELQGGDKGYIDESGKKILKQGGPAGKGKGKTTEEKTTKDKKNGGKDKIVKGGTKTWRQGEKAAESAGRDLNALVTERGKYKKGSDDYNKIQNQINKALGSGKRHGETTTTEGRKTTEVTPGISEKTTKTRKGGTVKKTTTTSDKGTKVEKFDKEGNIKKSKETITGKEVVGRAGVTGGEYEGTSDQIIKTKYKDGTKKKKTVKFKTDTDDDKKTIERRGRTKRKYDKSGEVKSYKKVVKVGGRRYVKKTKDIVGGDLTTGKTTTKSRRTLKGILTGKGKKKKEEE